MRLKISIVALLFCSVVFGQKSSDNLSFKGCFEALSNDNILRTEGWHNWGASIIKGDDGLYHLFYSRWKDVHSAWLTFSEIAHAVSDSPSGPWEYKETVLKGRGKGHWDAVTAHNPKIKCFDGKYYLYYISTNLGEMDYTDQDLIDTHGKTLKTSSVRKTLRENQRTGVAVSSSINGPWKRLDHPIIEPSGPITTLTVNPAIDKGADGKYYLIVKGDKPNETRFIRNQAIAVSETPVGPFIMQENPVIDYLDTEDMSLWFDKSRDRFYGIFHAHKYIGLITSKDGLKWQEARHAKVHEKLIPKKDGTFIKPDRMERPFVYLEDGSPRTLCMAVKKSNVSYIVFVPVKSK
ncbi:MAG: glycoside hydrolase family protein [Carboxylicivirga sp.]|nr:glycoside hydrolase family protein [Carboxylicivirga sp.]